MPETEITHDGQLAIATGRSRKDTSWRNKDWLWSDLVKKLSATVRTAESYKDYILAKKPWQDEKKDIGGFVGGYVTGGRRTATSVLTRQVVTLDIDFATEDLWLDFTLMYGCAAAMYTTHKHCPAKPRARLVIPLDEPVTAEEYQAISRRLAEKIGMDQFDHTTFQPSRLMYWPSTSNDGEFLFKVQDSPWLSAKSILGSYHNPNDASEWPVSGSETELVFSSIKKQGDPLEKNGLVGSFCRTYDIHEAISEFLPAEYTGCDHDENRYTFVEGSTAAGLVVYEGKYAYSNHGTDPASGKLCNAFDLVRLHKFGIQDDKMAEGTHISKMPSYLSMTEFAAKQPRVRKQIGLERLASTTADFGEPYIDEEAEAYNDDWLEKLEADKKSNYMSTIDNVKLILDNDPWLKGRIAKDTFEVREVVLKDLPWRKLDVSKYMMDIDDDGLNHYIEKTYGISSVPKIKSALNLICQQNSFHPVRTYLNLQKWDEVDRVDSLWIDYLGAADTEYTRAVTRKVLVAAVARIFRPGIKFDYITVLVGEQGQGKSQIIDRLGMQWFSDSFGTIQGKEAYEQIQGVWLVEMGELAGLKKADVEATKHFISKREDRYRVPYGRRLENFPRQCIFIGTSNDMNFLNDPSGNRRFWPIDTMAVVPIKDVYVDLDSEEVGQIWAEAVVIFKKGETLFLTSELEEEAKKIQNLHSKVDDRAGMVGKYLDTLLPDTWEAMDIYDRRSFIKGADTDGLSLVGTVQRQVVSVAEVWCEVLDGQQKDMSANNTKDLHNMMRNMKGWEPDNERSTTDRYGKQKVYRRVVLGLSVNSKNILEETKNQFI